MSGRYSLRQTPKKTEHLGFVETPRARRSYTRRKSQFPDSEGDDSSSATDSSVIHAETTRASRRKVSMVEQVTKNNVSTAAAAANGEINGTGVATMMPTNLHSDSPDGSTTAATTLKEKRQIVPDEHRVIEGWEVGKDPKIDYSGHFEFGGSVGVTAMMIGFPLLMYYMWIGATFYDGKIPSWEPGQDWKAFGQHLFDLVYEHAFPSRFAWEIYWSFFVFEAACYCLLPGVYTYGKPLPHEGGRQLKYYCSALWSFYTTIIVTGVLHYTRIFPLYTLIDEFGPLLSVAILSGFGVSIIAYFSALIRGAQHRMTGYPLYDFFMGAELNPRMFGILDFKMFFEVRLPWYILFGISCATAARQYEQLGYVSAEVIFLVMAHFLYANACSKGEECIPTTWDMYFEKWGFMLIFWNLAGVPLSYCHCTIYLANHLAEIHNYPFRTPFLIALFTSYLFMYWVWDTANSQKNRFRASERGTLIKRYTFPQLPWGTLTNPNVIRTESGDTILVDGWYGLARKVHYTCDLYFAITWGLVTGFKSPFPWFYPVFFACMIVHRAWRDVQKCRAKYGEAWKEYERRVPYLFIPYIF